MNTKPAWRIALAGAADLDTVRLLMKAYAAGLGIDLDAQGFGREIADLPGSYAPPAGALLLAFGQDGRPLGMIALRPLSPQMGEIKRLYVTPQGRGLGLGKALAHAVLEEAHRIGYPELKLDTLPEMKQAIALPKPGLRTHRPLRQFSLSGPALLWAAPLRFSATCASPPRSLLEKDGDADGNARKFPRRPSPRL